MSYLQSRWMAGALLFAGLSCNLYAVDGVILIDQNRALAGNVTPGDAPGFPVTISQPGSYRLQGTLRVPVDTTAIEIASDDVTIDLNGFAMFGDSSGPYQTVGAIVDAGRRTRITIHNGSIAGFSAGIYLRTSSHVIVEHMNVYLIVGFYAGGIVIGNTLSSNAIIRENISVGMIQVTCPALITNNVATAYEFENPIGGGACVTSNNVKAP